MNDVLELKAIKHEIASKCAFSLGKQMIEETKPSSSMLKIALDLKRCKQAISALNSYGDMPMYGVHDIRSSVSAAMKNATLTPQELMHCTTLMHTCKLIQNYMKQVEKEKDLLEELTDSLMIDDRCIRKIESCISQNYEVMDSASTELRNIRKRIRTLESDLNSQINSFIQAHASKLTDTITTTRNDRVCVLVKISEKNTIKGFIHGESASGATAYVEPECAIHINNKLFAARSAEEEEINKILFECSQEIKRCGNILLADCETLGILDAVFAKAAYALKINGCVAEMSEHETEIYLKRARHPLIDPTKVISNTYYLASDKKILLITGSNTGGKTVTLKTIGLFVLMSQCGFPIACDEARLPFFDQVFVDIGDEQSIEQSLSTFSAHLSKLAHFCDHATEKSLIILDELGSGTDPKEGEALAIAVLDFLRQKNCHVLASTHYSRLKLVGAKWPEVLCSSVEFDIEKMQPTYRYIEGLSGQSNALAIARRFNLREQIITQAEKIKEENESEQEKLSARLDSMIEENIQLRKQLDEKIKNIEEAEQRLMQQKQQFELQRIKLLDDAQMEAYEIVENAKEASAQVIEELKAASNMKMHEMLAVREKLDHIVEEKEAEVSDEAFAVGDYVLIKKYNYYGDVIEVKPKYIVVFANGIKMKLQPSECTHAKKQKKAKKEVSIGKAIRSSFSLECNVIGERVSDALPIIDKYLDNAVIARVKTVRLVHGMGTGALRSAIWDYLKKNKLVESWRVGGEGEGGSGATVVTLKSKG